MCSGVYVIWENECIFSPQYHKIPAGPIPPTTPKYAYGTVGMKKVSRQRTLFPMNITFKYFFVTGFTKNYYYY